MVKVPEVIYNANLKKRLLQNPNFASKLALFKVKEIFKDEFSTNTAPSVFIGSKLPYPQLNVGILSPPEKKENVWLYDAQKHWSDNNFDIFRIMELRSSLINSRFRTTAKAVRTNESRFLELTKEVGMSSKPVDTEVKLKKKIKLKINFDDTTLPLGPRGNLIKLSIGNTKISQRIDKVYSDTDMKAVESLQYLNKFGFDEQKLSQLLSIGILGQKKRRILVPTRWSIVATHSILANEKLSRIKSYQILNEFRYFHGSYLGNHYFILFFPESYNYELFETYLPGSFWNPTTNINMATDFEPFKGKTEYAKNTVGGFYATRLGITEYLDKIKKQASVLVLRIESDEYWASLGVWVVLASVRKALINNKVIFYDKFRALEYFKEQVFNRFKLDIGNTLRNSKLLGAIQQRKLMDF